MRAFIFPGQGSQSVGMGKALAEAFAAAREVFEEVDDALKPFLNRGPRGLEQTPLSTRSIAIARPRAAPASPHR